MLTRFLVKHKPSGHYIPDPKGRLGRGGSHTEPNPDSSQARLFLTKQGARNFISAWCQGKFVASRGMSHGHPGNDWESDYYEDISIIPVPHRKKEDMEIITIEVPLP